MKNPTVHNITKSIAYLSLVFFAFINPYLVDGFVRLAITYFEQQILA